MERLSGVEELLDGPLEDLVAVAGNLRDLRRANRLLGGARLSRLAIARLVGGNEGDVGADEVTLVDVGTGGADIPVALLADAARHRRRMRVTAVDSRPEVLAAARLARPAIDGLTGLRLEVADGRCLPYPDGAFDVAHSSMVAHHMEPEDVVLHLREMARVARRGVVLNDLIRGRLYLAVAWTLAHVATRNPLTRRDAPLSVERAYTRPELRRLVAEAGLRVVDEVDGIGWHRVAIAAVRS
jgi:ubiquinone/menaquinone biosynthesis C-methylase UbiE